MTERLTLSIDAMGGDNAPQMVVEGIEASLERLAQATFLLFGNEAELEPLLEKHPHAAAVSEIRHTADVVTNEEKASAALRSDRNSSMRLAINAVDTGEAAGVISAGNTALMAGKSWNQRAQPDIICLRATYQNQCIGSKEGSID